ncbi:UNVERIFIED_CONTAM: hypothetical protein K2H54_005216 [Gekko kuhli]
MSAASLTQWGHFNPGSTTETYLLMEGQRRESPWDPQAPSGYQISCFSTDPGGAMEGFSAGWYEDALDGCGGTPAEVEMTAIENNQINLQRHLEEVMRAIPEMVVRALAAEKAAEQQQQPQ